VDVGAVANRLERLRKAGEVGVRDVDNGQSFPTGRQVGEVSGNRNRPNIAREVDVPSLPELRGLRDVDDPQSAAVVSNIEVLARYVEATHDTRGFERLDFLPLRGGCAASCLYLHDSDSSAGTKVEVLARDRAGEHRSSVPASKHLEILRRGFSNRRF